MHSVKLPCRETALQKLKGYKGLVLQLKYDILPSKSRQCQVIDLSFQFVVAPQLDRKCALHCNTVSFEVSYCAAYSLCSVYVRRFGKDQVSAATISQSSPTQGTPRGASAGRCNLSPPSMTTHSVDAFSLATCAVPFHDGSDHKLRRFDSILGGSYMGMRHKRPRRG